MESSEEIVTVFWIGTIAMVSLVFGMLFLVLFYQNYFSKMKRKEAESLLQIALESEQKERQRIAADLHDGVSSDLTGIRNYILLLSRKELDNDKKLLFADLQLGVENAIESIRLVSYQLMPPLLQEYGFLAAITDYFDQLAKNNNLLFNVICKDLHADIVASTGYELFRIVQEFCTNMIKYGQISSCTLVLYQIENTFFLELIDDGVGFDFKSALQLSKGAGLKSINSRIQFIGGVLEQREVSVGNHFMLQI